MSTSSPVPESGRRRSYEREYVEGLFDSIAPKYDFLNHSLSFGVDVLWRRRLINELRPHAPQHILDIATGTGDLAIAARTLHPREIVGVDPSERMLELARRKIARRGLQSVIHVRRGSAEQLPFNDASFDCVTAAFGVRNFSDLSAGLQEMVRVLRRGGIAAILEFSKTSHPVITSVYRFYARTVIPALGGVVSGRREAYQYLPSTVAEFPSGAAFEAILRRAGFRDVSRLEQTFGIATIYLAVA